MTTMRRYTAVGMVALLAVAGLAERLYGATNYTANLHSGVNPAIAVRLPLRSGGLVVADFNNDGKMDAAVPGSFIAGVDVVFGDGALQSWFNTGVWPVALAAADLDGDGDVDLAVAEQDGGGVAVLTNDGTGQFARTGPWLTGPEGEAVGPVAVVPADLDKDGKLDLVVANRFAETVVVLRRTVSGYVLSQSLAVSGEPTALVVADLDGNGWLDVTAACAAQDKVKVLKNTGGTLNFSGHAEAGPCPEALAGGDLDGDGDIDLAAADREAPQVTVLINNGTGAFAAREVMLGDPNVRFEPPVDLQLVHWNFDGKLDIRCGGVTLMNDGTGNFTVFERASGIGAVYAQGFLAGDLTPFLGVSFRSATSMIGDPVTVESHARKPGDIDGDMHVDVTDLLWLAGSWAKSTGEEGFDPAADLNNDGTVDVTDLMLLAGDWGT